MEHAAVAPKTVSGKRATIVMLAILLSTGGLFYWVTMAYTTYNAARRQTERNWRELATELDIRYRAVDKAIEAQTATLPLDAELVQSWQSARQSFTATALSRNQIESARQLEALIERMPDSIRQVAAPEPKLTETLATYEDSAQHQREIGQRTGSKLLKTMLILPDPTDLQLH